MMGGDKQTPVLELREVVLLDLNLGTYLLDATLPRHKFSVVKHYLTTVRFTVMF
jgi:hypothetical protein